MNMEFRVSLKDSKPCTQSEISTRLWQIQGPSEVGNLAINHVKKKQYLYIYMHVYAVVIYNYIYISHVWPTVSHFKWANFYTIVISPPKNGSSCVLLSSFPGVVPATRNRFGTLVPWSRSLKMVTAIQAKNKIVPLGVGIGIGGTRIRKKIHSGKVR